MAGVDTSDIYMGTIMVSMPTENPAIARPAMTSKLDIPTTTQDVVQRTCKEHRNRPCSGLQSRAQREDDHSNKDGSFTAHPVRDRPVDQRPEPGEQQKRRHKPALEAAVEVDAREFGGERLHGQHARDDALVIAEEEAPQGRELVE